MRKYVVRGVGKCWGRYGKACWDVEKLKKDVGSVRGRALNEVMRLLTFRAHVLHCEGR